MKARDITLIRWVIVAFYTILGLLITPGGVSSGELTLMVVTGIAGFVGIVTADWINEAAQVKADE